MMHLVPRSVLERTFEFFRTCGAGLRECQILWTSSWHSPQTITSAVHPAHRSHGAGFAVEASWLNTFWLSLASKGHGVRVQVHTHPGEAFHSQTDDAYPIVHTPGFLSLVIPHFALGPVGFDDAFLAEIAPDGSWRQVDIVSRLKIVE